ncbi:hypothetical protein LHU53_08745 [Rhodoferax sp. U2-2l]|uniref:hypothetical protein n=1 Tax=Rhodoferax sp. U2-2l TaxID=2884000 RepID=UPI001D09BFAC|nr:hypothetical protein [Rhodoferax sp. U2-2l]MCB8746993.1 hypothetical protein [Rhodoferax sp. U2-2l]
MNPLTPPPSTTVRTDEKLAKHAVACALGGAAAGAAANPEDLGRADAVPTNSLAMAAVPILQQHGLDFAAA